MSLLRNVVLGVLFTLLLLGFLAVTRLIFLKLEPNDLMLTPLQTITLPPPLEPPPVQPDQQNDLEEAVPAPAPPSLVDLPPSVDVASLAMPSMLESVPLDLSVDLFSLEVQPRPLVIIPTKKVVSSLNSTTPPVKVGGVLGIGDLDGNPSVRRAGQFRWPSRVRSNLVNALVKVEINEKGTVKLLEIKSVSEEAMRKVLPSMVNGSRFSVPKKNGKPVKVILNWPLILEKP